MRRIVSAAACAALYSRGPQTTRRFECVAVDVIKADSRIDHAASRMALPPAARNHGLDVSGLDVPPVFVINMQTPFQIGMWGGVDEDDPGCSLVLWFKLRESTVAELRKGPDAKESVRLLAQCVMCSTMQALPSRVWRAPITDQLPSPAGTSVTARPMQARGSV